MLQQAMRDVTTAFWRVSQTLWCRLLEHASQLQAAYSVKCLGKCARQISNDVQRSGHALVMYRFRKCLQWLSKPMKNIYSICSNSDSCPGPPKYKVVQIWPGRFVCKQVTVCPGHIWTTLYKANVQIITPQFCEHEVTLSYSTSRLMYEVGLIVTPWTLVSSYRRFGRACCLHLQSLAVHFLSLLDTEDTDITPLRKVICHSVRRHMPSDSNLHRHHCLSLKPRASRLLDGPKRVQVTTEHC